MPSIKFRNNSSNDQIPALDCLLIWSSFLFIFNQTFFLAQSGIYIHIIYLTQKMRVGISTVSQKKLVSNWVFLNILCSWYMEWTPFMIPIEARPNGVDSTHGRSFVRATNAWAVDGMLCIYIYIYVTEGPCCDTQGLSFSGDIQDPFRKKGHVHVLQEMITSILFDQMKDVVFFSIKVNLW